jgi:hypothetical protein
MFFQLSHVSRGKRLEHSFTLSRCDTEPVSLYSTRCGEVICSMGRSYINILRAFPTFPLTKCPEPHLNCYLLLFSKCPDRLWAHPASFGIDTGLLSPGYSGLGVKLISYLYLVQKLRISVAMRLLSFCFLGVDREILTSTSHLPASPQRWGVNIFPWTVRVGRCGGLTTRFHSYFTVPVTEFDIHLATLCVLIPISPYAACHNWRARRQTGHGPLLLYHA